MLTLFERHTTEIVLEERENKKNLFVFKKIPRCIFRHFVGITNLEIKSNTTNNKPCCLPRTYRVFGGKARKKKKKESRARLDSKSTQQRGHNKIQILNFIYIV